MSNQGFGGYGSLTWHTAWVEALDSVDEVNNYLDELALPPVIAVDLKAAQGEAIQRITEKVDEDGSKTLRSDL